MCGTSKLELKHQHQHVADIIHAFQGKVDSEIKLICSLTCYGEPLNPKDSLSNFYPLGEKDFFIRQGKCMRQINNVIM